MCFFFSSHPVPGLWGPPGLISGIKLFQGNKFFKIRSVWFGEARLLIFYAYMFNQLSKFILQLFFCIPDLRDPK